MKMDETVENEYLKARIVVLENRLEETERWLKEAIDELRKKS